MLGLLRCRHDRGAALACLLALGLLAASCGSQAEEATGPREDVQVPATTTTTAAPDTGAAPEVSPPPEAAPAAPAVAPAPGIAPAVPAAPPAARTRAAAAPNSGKRAPTPAAGGPGAASRSAGAANPQAPAPAATPGPAGDPAAAPGSPIPAPAPQVEKKYDQGVSDTEVKFASVSSVTGVYVDLFVPRGARAYFKYVNSLGGINGRKLSMVIYDDQWDPTRHAALVRQAFDDDKVFAFVANQAPFSSHGGQAFMEKNRIPVIGGDVIDFRTWTKSPMYYPHIYMESVTGARIAGRYAVEQLGCKKVAGFAMAVDESRGWRDNFGVGVKDRNGEGLVYAADISFAETDYTPYVAAAKSKGADCITVGAGAPNFIRTQKAAEQQGYKPKYIWTAAGYDPEYLKTAGSLAEGSYFMIPVHPLEDDADPSVKEFKAAAAKFEPGMKASAYAATAWSAARIAGEVVRRMGDNLTRENALKTLNELKDFATGLVPPVSFTNDNHPDPTCGNIVQARGGTFVPVTLGVCL